MGEAGGANPKDCERRTCAQDVISFFVELQAK